MTPQAQNLVPIVANETVGETRPSDFFTRLSGTGLDAGGDLIGQARSRFGRDAEHLKPEAARRVAA